jgi:LysR family glycine cleavage system transcriptional activator
MMRSLPPLNALHAFEVTARHLSFQQAAEELGVTSTAISHQIKILEDYLQVSLFRRHPRPLALTESGKLLYPLIGKNLDAIAEITDQIRYPTCTVLTVSVTTVFATKWLVPRLFEFQRTHPEIDLRLQTSNDVVDLQQRTVDLAIRYGRGDYPGLVVRPLMSDLFMPVCSPHLLKDKHPISQPEDIKHHPLLHFEWIHFGSEAPDWKNWLRSTGVNSVDPNCGLKFNEESLVIQAAIAGQGIALCSNMHVANDIAAGSLVSPLEVFLEGFKYSSVYLEDHPKEMLILKFVDWLVEMIQVENVLNKQAQ